MVKQLSARLYNPEELRKETPTKDIALQKQPIADSYNESFLKNFLKITGKHLCQSLYLMKFQTSSQQFTEERLQHRCFPVNSTRILRTPFLLKLLEQLLLNSQAKQYERARNIKAAMSYTSICWYL